MEVHILNGDALKSQFPDSLKGKIIVARECLVDGDVSGKDIEEIFKNRETFLNKTYDIPVRNYQKTREEFNKIKEIPENSNVNFWFEDDLFCQVNFWFSVFFLTKEAEHINNVFLVRPITAALQFGFGSLSEKELEDAYRKRKRISSNGLKYLGKLWECYQSNDIEQLHRTGQKVIIEFPFIPEVINAHNERRLGENSLGRPEGAIKKIIGDLGTNDFGSVFREFSKRESIYGFGDLQVKTIMKEMGVIE